MKKGTALVPTFLAFAVTKLLEEHYAKLVDYGFTASMEDDLDKIAAGEEQRVDWLTRFYKGENGEPGLHAMVTDHLDEIDARAVNSIELPGSDIVVRVGSTGRTWSAATRELRCPRTSSPTSSRRRAPRSCSPLPAMRASSAQHPETRLSVVLRSGRYGPYVTEELPEGSEEKPRTASLLSTMTPETVTLDDAVRLLSLPRVVGVSDGEEVLAMNGRYGPFIKRGTDTRSLESEEQIFSIDLDHANALLAAPKTRRGRGAAKPPLREMGPDPSSGRPVVVKDGRFGPYVTDGETNASLRAGDAVESLTLDRAIELLAERRSKGPAKKRPRGRK